MAIPVSRNDWTGAGQNNILFLNGIPAAGKIGKGSERESLNLGLIF
jgi:hypothetical protein